MQRNYNNLYYQSKAKKDSLSDIALKFYSEDRVDLKIKNLKERMKTIDNDFEKMTFIEKEKYYKKANLAVQNKLLKKTESEKESNTEVKLNEAVFDGDTIYSIDKNIIRDSKPIFFGHFVKGEFVRVLGIEKLKN